MNHINDIYRNSIVGSNQYSSAVWKQVVCNNNDHCYERLEYTDGQESDFPLKPTNHFQFDPPELFLKKYTNTTNKSVRLLLDSFSPDLHFPKKETIKRERVEKERETNEKR